MGEGQAFHPLFHFVWKCNIIIANQNIIIANKDMLIAKTNMLMDYFFHWDDLKKHRSD